MSNTQDTRAKRIRELLQAELAPTHLEIVDESAQHSGNRRETHFHLTLQSARFAGESRVARHKLVYRLLADEFASGLHAVTLSLSAEDQTGIDSPPCLHNSENK